MAFLSTLISLAFLPILTGFYYSHHQDILSLFGSLLFIVLFSIALFIATSRLNKWLALGFNLIAFLTILVFEIMRAISFYLQGSGFNDRFFFHLSFGTIKSTWFNYPILFWLTLLLLGIITFFIYQLNQKRIFQQSSLIIAISLFIPALFPSSAIKEFSEYTYERFSDNQRVWTLDDAETLGLNPEAILQDHTAIAKPGRNLVLIYMESLESIYTDNTIFKSLTPHLNNFKQNGVWFSNISQTPGTSWTIAGIASSLCGSPLLYNNKSDGNDILLQGFFNNAVCLSDILHDLGYKQSYIGGATLDFAGKGYFLRNHHYDDVLGLDELILEHEEPDYVSNWGLYDDTLMDKAWQKFQTLAKENKPFNLTILTLDTHHPTGHASASCTPYSPIDNSILHAVHCTDQLLKKFIDRLANHPSWDNTTVVLFSDHLSMRNEAEKFYPDDYERNLSFIVLNSHLKGQITTPGNHMDFAPTVLDLLKIQSNNQFLVGKSLLRTTNTPAIQLKEQNTLSAIKYINSHYLTKKDTQICPDQKFKLQTTQEQHLVIGDHKMPLSYQGRPIKHTNFIKNLALIAFFNDQKNIENAMIVDKNEVPALIQQYPKFDILLLTSDKQQLSLYFGDISGLINIPLPANSHIDQLDISLNGCLDKSTFSQAKNFILTDNDFYKKQCQKIPLHLRPVYSTESQRLYLPEVIYNKVVYSATLQKEKHEPLFNLVNYQEKSESQSEEKNYCHPKLTGKMLYIPQIDILGNNFSITLSTSISNPTQLLIPQALQQAVF